MKPVFGPNSQLRAVFGLVAQSDVKEQVVRDLISTEAKSDGPGSNDRAPPIVRNDFNVRIVSMRSW